MRIGYARVSRTEQDHALQRDALSSAQVETVYEEKRSSVKARPELARAIASLRPGDEFIVWKVDRTSRSLSDLLGLIERVQGAGASFRSLTESFDTSTPSGMLMVQLLGAFAQYERAMIRERSMAGQDAARARGAKIGRPRSMSSVDEAEAVHQVLKQGQTMASVARVYGVHLSSVKRACLRVTKKKTKGRAFPYGTGL